MGGIFFVDSVRVWLRRRSREKKLRAAQAWPVATAEVNRWEILNADEEASSVGARQQIEAGFHFTLNGEYYGGYLRSVAMTLHEAEKKPQGSPKANIRITRGNLMRRGRWVRTTPKNFLLASSLVESCATARNGLTRSRSVHRDQHI